MTKMMQKPTCTGQIAFAAQELMLTSHPTQVRSVKEEAPSVVLPHHTYCVQLRKSMTTYFAKGLSLRSGDQCGRLLATVCCSVALTSLFHLGGERCGQLVGNHLAKFAPLRGVKAPVDTEVHAAVVVLLHSVIHSHSADLHMLPL